MKDELRQSASVEDSSFILPPSSLAHAFVEQPGVHGLPVTQEITGSNPVEGAVRETASNKEMSHGWKNRSLHSL